MANPKEEIIKAVSVAPTLFLTEDDIRHRIYTIRDVQVMLDKDLALLYEVETKRINEAVKRNQTRFPVDFYFQLTKEEWDFLMSQSATSRSESNLMTM